MTFVQLLLKRKDNHPLDTISVSLKVLPLNGSVAKDESGSTEYMCNGGHFRSNQRNVAPQVSILQLLYYLPSYFPDLTRRELGLR